MRIKYDVAILMKKVELCAGYTFYVPVQVITGNYNNEEGYFETQDKESYYDIDSFTNTLDLQEEFMCCYVMTGKEFSKKYSEYTNISDAFLQYKKDNANFKLSYYDDDLSKINTIGFDISNLSKINEQEQIIEFTSEIDNNDQFNLSLDPKDIVRVYNSLREFIEQYADDEDALDSMWESLNNSCDYYKDIMNRIEYIRYQVNNGGKVTYAFSDEFEKPDLTLKKKLETKNTTTNAPSIEDKIEYYKKRKQIIKELKEVIKGHDEQVDKFVVEMFRLQNQYGNKNRGIMLTGSTGVGKTRLCSLMSEKLDLPFKIIDTTQLTIPGYKGKDFTDFLEELYDSENGNLDRVEHAILFFDEIDKGGRKKDNYVNGEGIYNGILKTMDGTNYTIKDGMHNRSDEKRIISTKNMIIIIAGTFSSIYQNKKFKSQGVGFNLKKETKLEKFQNEPTIEDFVELANVPDELIGRFPIVIHLEDLDKEKLKDILLNSSESPILDKQKEFMGEANVKLEFTEEAIDTIADIAIELKTGARGLQKVVEQATTTAFKDITDNIGEYDRVIITEETVLDSKHYTVKTKGETSKKYIKVD